MTSMSSGCSDEPGLDCRGSRRWCDGFSRAEMWVERVARRMVWMSSWVVVEGKRSMVGRVDDEVEEKEVMMMMLTMNRLGDCFNSTSQFDISRQYIKRYPTH